uniref:TNFR-Cys domain-containing protein n=1 Tax=Romanomermis culicivorax TaxID=13658 RepID=A0A915KE32_ROMCU
MANPDLTSICANSFVALHSFIKYKTMDLKPLIIVSSFLAISFGFVIMEKDSLSEKKSSLKMAELDLLRPRDLLSEVDLIQPIDIVSIVEDDSENSFKNDVIESEYEMINGILCRKCPPGTGLIATCNATHQTVCGSCQAGVSYSSNVPHFRPCSPCSRCGPGMFVDKMCSPELDTFCDWCHGVKNTDYLRTLLAENENFLEKCDVITSLNKLNADELTQDQVHDSSEESEIVTKSVTGQNSSTIDPFIAIDELIIEDSEASEEKNIKQDKIDQVPLVAAKNVEKPVSDNFADDKDIAYKPSVHNYPYEELVHHPNGTLSIIVENRHLILSVACILCFLATLLIFRRRSCHQSKKVKEVWITSTLTDEDDRSISDEIASEDETETDEASAQNSDVNVRENPLLGYLEHEIDCSKIDAHDTTKSVDV